MRFTSRQNLSYFWERIKKYIDNRIDCGTIHLSFARHSEPKESEEYADRVLTHNYFFVINVDGINVEQLPEGTKICVYRRQRVHSVRQICRSSHKKVHGVWKEETDIEKLNPLHSEYDNGRWRWNILRFGFEEVKKFFMCKVVVKDEDENKYVAIRNGKRRIVWNGNSNQLFARWGFALVNADGVRMSDILPFRIGFFGGDILEMAENGEVSVKG